MQITITINGIERKFIADIDTLHNNDWNEIMRDMIDSHDEKE